MTTLSPHPQFGPLAAGPPLLTGPFRGSRAIAGGLVTRGVLRGPQFRRLFPDVYAPAHLEVDLALLARAAYLLVEGRGVVAGYAAAELLGASCAPPGAPAELLMFAGRQRRSGPNLVVHRDLLGRGEIERHGDVLVTHAVRVAYDLSRWAPDLTEKVVAVDTLAHRRFPIAAVRALARRHLGAHHTRELARVLELADPRSGSPMESRIRMTLLFAGLPTPVLQHPVTIEGRRYELDLAYPDLKIAIEYDGIEHRTQQRAHRDLRREADLVRLGWTILRFDADTVLHQSVGLAADVRAELRHRASIMGIGR